MCFIVVQTDKMLVQFEAKNWPFQLLYGSNRYTHVRRYNDSYTTILCFSPLPIFRYFIFDKCR